jgi:RNA recognition motif-containing protein
MNLFVGNLNPQTTAESLRTLFEEYGVVVSSKIIFDNATGEPRGFGFVEMEDKGHSYDAIDNIDAVFFEGNIISVKEAKQNNTKTGGGSKPFKKPGGFKPGGFKPGGYNSSAPRPSNIDRFNSLNNSRDQNNRD